MLYTTTWCCVLTWLQRAGSGQQHLAPAGHLHPAEGAGPRGAGGGQGPGNDGRRTGLCTSFWLVPSGGKQRCRVNFALRGKWRMFVGDVPMSESVFWILWLTDPDPTPDPTPFFSDFKDDKKNFFSIFFSYNLPAGTVSSVLKTYFFA